MKLETRYAHRPDDVKAYATEALRRRFRVGQVFGRVDNLRNNAAIIIRNDPVDFSD